jgi:hypothetical protein
MRFAIIVQDKANPINLSQLLWGSLGIATSSNKQGIRISPVCQPEPVTRFAIGYMGNGAGIKYIDISLISWRYQPVPCLSQLSS